jgi:hypothetical protein
MCTTRGREITPILSPPWKCVNQHYSNEGKLRRKQRIVAEQTDHLHWLHAFASLYRYEETIKFVFTFVTKTSELLLAAGIVISTINFLTDDDVMLARFSLL